MTTTLIIGLAILLTVATITLVLDRLEQRSKKRDRKIMRQLHTYMAQLPPARPW